MLPISNMVGRVSARTYSEADNKDIDLIILVDESTSLSPGDVEQEQRAVANVIELPALLNQRIRVQVLPFSSGAASPRILTGCEFTELTPDGQDYLLKYCPPQIRREKKDTGVDPAGNTDFSKAIDVAIQKFLEQGDQKRRKAILLLTDGQYDPDGDRMISPEEQRSLESVLTRANQEQIYIWPLGFGDASSIDLEALRNYASKGFQGEGECPSPEAALSAPDQLAVQIYSIIGSISCTKPVPPGPSPSQIRIHPLINRISAVVLGSSEIPTMKDSLENVVCSNQWISRSGNFSCQLDLDGTRPGTWTVIGSTNSQVVWNLSGEVVVDLSECDSRPELVIERPDQNPISWSEEFPWPSVLVTEFDDLGDTVGDSYLVELSRPQQVLRIKPETQRITAEFVPSSDELLKGISLVDKAECDVSKIPPVPTSDGTEGSTVENDPSTTTVSSDPVPTDSGGSSEPEPDPGPGIPWPLILLIAAVIVLGIFGLRRLLGSRRFPANSELMQRMPSGRWILLAVDLAGLRQVGIKLPSPGGPAVQVEPSDDERDFVLTYCGTEVLVTFSAEAGSEDQEERREAINYPFRVKDFEFKVEVLEATEEVDVDE